MTDSNGAGPLLAIDFQMLLDASPDPTAVVDREGRFVAANRVLQDLLRSASGLEVVPLVVPVIQT